MASFTIEDLKKHLGPGLGLRKNKYLLEIPIPGTAGQSLNILCRSAGLPERNMTTTEAFHRGRKYVMRGETDYGGSYEISIVDDSSMNIRKIFDQWLLKVDNTEPKGIGQNGASFEANFLDSKQNDFFLALKQNTGPETYSTDINIWQLSGTGQKVYGYKLQNAFPSSSGIVTLDDGDENTLSEFSVTLSFSEFIPLENTSFVDGTGNILNTSGIIEGVESLFD